MIFKRKCFFNVIGIVIAIAFGFTLSRFVNPSLCTINQLDKQKFFQKSREDERALAFLMIGGEYLPNYTNPRTLNDKITYIARNYFKKSPLTEYIVNKYRAKRYIADIVGKEHVVKLLGVWNNPEDIEWDKLPSKFVLKTVHGTFGKQIMLVKDKSTINIHEAIKKLKIFCQYYEMQERGITSERIIAEEYLEQPNSNNGIVDYKIFCSYGNPIVAYRHTNTTINAREEDKASALYSIPEWKKLPVQINNRRSDTTPKPKHFAQMIELAKKLSKPFPLIRVDFYEIGDRVLVGELTRDSGDGKYLFSPVIWDFKLGEMVDVPSLSEIDKLIERDKKMCKENNLLDT